MKRRVQYAPAAGRRGSADRYGSTKRTKIFSKPTRTATEASTGSVKPWVVGLAALAGAALVALIAFWPDNNPNPPDQLEAGAIALTSFEQGQPGLIDLAADPEFGATAELVSSGQGITSGRNAARATLVTDNSNPAIDPTFQNLVRLDIGEFKSEFTADRKLKIDFLFEGTAGAHGDLALAYFDNRSGELHLFQRTDFQKSEGSPSTIVFDLDSPGSIGKGSATQSLADLIGGDYGKAILNLIAAKDAATAGTITIDNLRFLPGPASRTNPTPVSADGFITIEGDNTRYTDLSQAIDAAGNGATLLLSGDFRCPETVFTRHAQSIHLRCAPGAKATVIAETPGRHAVFFQGPATLEGIRFVRLKAEPYCRPIVGIRAAEGIVVTNCEFQTPAVSDPRFGGGALGVSGRMSTISRCRFDTPGSAAIFFVGGSIRIEECVAVGHRLIYRREEIKNSPRSADITIERCIAHCDELFYSSYDQPLYPAALTVRDSLLNLSGQLLVLPDSPTDLIREHLSWTGENNHYPSKLTLVSAPKMKAGDDFVPSTFATPSDLPKASENNPTYGPIFDAQELFTQPSPAELHAALAANIDSPALSVLKAFLKQGDRARIVGRVRIEGDDQIFPDFSEAVSAAPDGATLLLSGDIHCAETVSTLPGQIIHLRPAPGATPSVIADDPLETTLLFRGPTTIEGIRFSRPNAARNSLPIVSTINSPSIVVTDCMFQTSPVTENRLGGGALGASARSSKFIRCRFDTPGNAAILINGGEVHIEECVAVGHRFIYRRDRIPNRSVEIVIERSVALCGELFSGSHHNPLYPTSLTVRDSLLDLRDQLLVLPDSPAHLIWENLSWTGENNHYPSNVTLLTAPRMGAETGFVASTFKTVSELPGATENNPTYGEIFDLKRLPQKPTPADLRAALRSGVPWPLAR